MKFNSDKFSFNGIHCRNKNVSLLWGDDSFIEYGLSKSYSLDYDGVNWTENAENKPDTFVLHIIYEINNEAQIWDRNKIRDIETWLITEDFTPFVSDDNIEIVYYLKTINIIRRFDANMKGWLEVEFQPMSSYGYIHQNISLKNASRFLKMKSIPSMNIVNQSDLSNPYYPIIKIDNLVGEVSINNLTTNTIFTLSGAGNIVVDNKMKTVFDSKGNNLISSCNRQWVYFIKGNNRVQVIGDCNVTFISQYEVRA